jgi:hypothetical protein
MRRQLSPLSALARGLVAGAVGAGVQSLFFRLTARVAPAPPPEAFEPPEAQQRHEPPTGTVARRLRRLAGRDDLAGPAQARGSRLIHLGFGAAWGGAYALARESVPALARPAGALGYGSAVWMASENLLLPAFKLAGWPQRYPARTHAYAWAAHLVYGAAVATSYGFLRRRSLVPLLAGAWLTGRRWRLTRGLPRVLRPPVNAVFAALRPAVRTGARWATTAVRA